VRTGLAPVDDDWFAHGLPAPVLGVDARLCPVEEMIWHKAFIMERERYDGADVAHLLRAHAERIDWRRLLRRFEADLPVLLSHLVLFGYIYPSERHRLPDGLLEELLARISAEPVDLDGPPVCYGTLLSRAQYLVDICDWGYDDARCGARGAMTPTQAVEWSAAAPERPYAIRACSG
jgi:hypothetical protein